MVWGGWFSVLGLDLWFGWCVVCYYLLLVFVVRAKLLVVCGVIVVCCVIVLLRCVLGIVLFVLFGGLLF